MGLGDSDTGEDMYRRETEAERKKERRTDGRAERENTNTNLLTRPAARFKGGGGVGGDTKCKHMITQLRISAYTHQPN